MAYYDMFRFTNVSLEGATSSREFDASFMCFDPTRMHGRVQLFYFLFRLPSDNVQNLEMSHTTLLSLISYNLKTSELFHRCFGVRGESIT